MAYCTEDEVRGMIKDDALNTLIGDAYIEEPERRGETRPPRLTVIRYGGRNYSARLSRKRSRMQAARLMAISQRDTVFPFPGLRRF